MGLEIDGTGPAVEWAVEMARFDESKTLDHLAQCRRRSTPALAEALADVIRDPTTRADVSDGATWLASIATHHRSQHRRNFAAGAALARDAVERLA